ncbi:hypothetical protein HMN09_01066500 [Mycena chlorophos]|uniref:Uncharacterized protein n=1 Tax=Mycena chlorophos TaxID=658473 RepID=A0A8H6SEY0_MYCCL|nr:hypothetical protein HMN09_01066500 [Mycena chlorophos]
MFKSLGFRTTRSGREWSGYRMEVFDVDADALAHRTASNLRDESDEDYSGTKTRITFKARTRPKRPSLKTALAPRVALEDDDLDDLVRDGGFSRLPTRSHTSSLPAADFFSAHPQDQGRRPSTPASPGNARRQELLCQTHSPSHSDTPISTSTQAPRESLWRPTGFICLSDPTLNNRREKAAKVAAKKSRRTENAAPTPVLLPTAGKFTKAEMEAMGMTEDNWDGKSQVAYADCKGRQLAVLCGQPRDTLESNWGRDAAIAGFELMKQAAAELSPLGVDIHAAADGKEKRRRRKKKKKKRNVRRGDHRAETVGVGVGNGRQGPRNFRCDQDDAAILERLLQAEPFTRTAGFSNSILLNSHQNCTSTTGT